MPHEYLTPHHTTTCFSRASDQRYFFCYLHQKTRILTVNQHNTMLATTKPVSSSSNPPTPPLFSSDSKQSQIISINRRNLLASLSLTLAPFLTLDEFKNHSHYAHARGIFQMPPVRLVNRYYLMRAGESQYEGLDIINTNPVAKTSVDNGLSEKGIKQTLRAALELKSIGACESNCWIWPSITQRAYQAAEIIASVNGISRRYTPRIASPPNIKPPPVSDGTPNESVQDVFVRVTQLMSILETQYSGNTVVIVSPDSENLSVLQAGMVGLELRRHMDLALVQVK
ncbi:hypothetical protein SASPL_124881 [Salvia splendens]|uniref:Phosphoglycerate mutase n=1 Tax=Salvia splendens TaxID=180675 RepID=A0A8X8XEL2_SALSN|nr:hypothetical protein SASPL_124881 [Salvia splendens]